MTNVAEDLVLGIGGFGHQQLKIIDVV